MASKNKINNKFIFFIFCIFVIDIFLYQRSSSGSFISLQDIAATLSMFLIFTYTIKPLKTSLKMVYKSIVIYVVYLLISNLVLLYFGQLDFRFIFYMLKNIVYLTAFIITYLSFKYNSYYSQKIITYFLYFNSVYGLYLIGTNQISYYGIGTLFEDAPSRAGSIYFISMLVSFFFYQQSKKNKYIILAFLNAILMVMTIARTNILALIIFALLFLGLGIINYLFNNKKIKKQSILIFIGMFFLLVILYGVSQLYFNIASSNHMLLETLLERFNRISGSYDFRKNKSIGYLQFFFNGKGIGSILFGRGKGITEILLPTKEMAVDNQYVRSMIETGIMGMLLWLNMIRNIYNQMPKDRKVFFIAFFVSYLAMGMSYEVFTVTKGGIIFYFTLGLLLGYKKNVI